MCKNTISLLTDQDCVSQYVRTLVADVLLACYLSARFFLAPCSRRHLEGTARFPLVATVYTLL